MSSPPPARATARGPSAPLPPRTLLSEVIAAALVESWVTPSPSRHHLSRREHASTSCVTSPTSAVRPPPPSATLSPPLPAVALGAAELRVVSSTFTRLLRDRGVLPMRRWTPRAPQRHRCSSPSPEAALAALAASRRIGGYMRVDFSDARPLLGRPRSVPSSTSCRPGSPLGRRSRAVPPGAPPSRRARRRRAAQRFDHGRGGSKDAARRPLGWGCARRAASTSCASFRAAQRRVPLSPLGECHPRLPRGSDAQLDALREQADEDFEWPPSAFPKPPPPERRNRPL